MPGRTATRIFTQYFAHKDNHNNTKGGGSAGGKHSEAAAGLGGGRQQGDPGEGGIPTPDGTKAFPNNERPKSRPPCQPWDYNVSIFNSVVVSNIIFCIS